ncbi:MAG: adenylate/guanylate cyclase domain-containing protein [Alphaproteobacteria bacterium]
MAESEIKRKLTAILAADVAGYSRLMNDDEEATLRALRAHRQAMDAAIARHSGRIVGTAGDSVLAEFASAIEAVRCGIEIQKELNTMNTGVPDERRMDFRIGINLGDVMIEGDDIYGDGVNVAARLETIAEPGGICISSTVFEQVRDRLPHDFEDIGEHSVKNITRPVHIYRVPLLEKAQAKSAAKSGAAALELPNRPSIAVLPFENMNKDPEQDYFSDGITDDLITELSRLPDLFVISRNSVFTYKGKAAKVQDIAKELGVRYVLEGSVRKAGERVRITAQLIDAETGHHSWAERYDRELQDIFAVQDEITQTIVGVLAGKIAAEEIARAARKPTESLEAYDWFLRAYDAFLRFQKDEKEEARGMIGKALELDPKYARAYTLLGWSHLQDVFMGWSDDPVQSLTTSFEMAQKALSLDASDNWSHWVIGACLLFQRQHDKSLAAYHRAVDLRPNDADVLAHLSVPLIFVDQTEQALAVVKKAMRLNPHCPWWYNWVLGWAQLRCGHPEAAIAAIEKIGRPIPESHIIVIAAYMLLGQEAEARAEAEAMLRRDSSFSLDRWAATQPYRNPERLTEMVEALRHAGLPE